MTPWQEFDANVRDITWPELTFMAKSFLPYFEQAIALCTDTDSDSLVKKQYLMGIAKQSAANDVNIMLINRLTTFLDEIDTRRSLNWRKTFPWLTNNS